ncbi:MAG: hypothetical protein QMD86_02940 [Patescibacteria group bacterium]|nr:hypothetical protein [Patescibacteria group bacterium]
MNNNIHNYIIKGILGALVIYGLYLFAASIVEICVVCRSVSFSSSGATGSEINILYHYVANTAVMAILGVILSVFSYKLFRGEKEAFLFVMSGIAIFWSLHFIRPNGFAEHSIPLILSLPIFIYFLAKKDFMSGAGAEKL